MSVYGLQPFYNVTALLRVASEDQGSHTVFTAHTLWYDKQTLLDRIFLAAG